MSNGSVIISIGNSSEKKNAVIEEKLNYEKASSLFAGHAFYW